MWFLLCVIAAGVVGYHKYQGSYVQYKVDRFCALVNAYHDDEGYSYPLSLYHSSRIVARNLYIDLCTYVSVVKTPKYSFVRLFNGGSVNLLVVKNKHGPKKILEYAYFEDERMDEVVNLLLGPNRDFNGNPEVLLTLASRVRYKFIDDNEIIMESKNSTLPQKINYEIIKKILSMNTLEKSEKNEK